MMGTATSGACRSASLPTPLPPPAPPPPHLHHAALALADGFLEVQHWLAVRALALQEPASSGGTKEDVRRDEGRKPAPASDTS